MKTETELKALLKQKQVVLELKSPLTGYSWAETEIHIKAQIKLLEWILEEEQSNEPRKVCRCNKCKINFFDWYSARKHAEVCDGK